MTQEFIHGYGLFVGVGATAYPRLSLPVTVKDAQAFVATFTDTHLCAYPNNNQHIRLLHDTGATCQTILDNLNWLKLQASADPEATVIFYYSGHGAIDKTSGHYYLLPHDVDPDNPSKTALSAQILTDALHAISARQLLVFIDCCHAEGMASAKNLKGGINLSPELTQMAPPKSIVDALKQGEGRAVFTSSRGTQLSWIWPNQTMSIFTYHLIEALQGAANQPNDTEVHISHLMNYLAKTVPASTHSFYKEKQTPFFDIATEDFAVALLYVDV